MIKTELRLFKFIKQKCHTIQKLLFYYNSNAILNRDNDSSESQCNLFISHFQAVSVYPDLYSYLVFVSLIYFSSVTVGSGLFIDAVLSLKTRSFYTCILNTGLIRVYSFAKCEYLLHRSNTYLLLLNVFSCIFYYLCYMQAHSKKVQTFIGLCLVDCWQACLVQIHKRQSAFSDCISSSYTVYISPK